MRPVRIITYAMPFQLSHDFSSAVVEISYANLHFSTYHFCALLSNLAHACSDPPPELLLPEKVTGSNYRKITVYLVQGRSLGRNKSDGQRRTMIHLDVTLEKPAETIRRSIEVSAT